MEPHNIYKDVDAHFKPITEVNFHSIPNTDTPINNPPKETDTGITLLNKSFRDLAGTPIETKHLLTHEADTLTEKTKQCWACTRAATRQQRKYSEKSGRTGKDTNTGM